MAIVEFELRRGEPAAVEFSGWLENLGPVLLEGRTDPRTHPFFSVESSRDQYDILYEATPEDLSDFQRKIELQKWINLVLYSQRAVYELESFETQVETVGHLQTVINRMRTIRDRLRTGDERNADMRYKRFNAFLWPPLKAFVEDLAQQVDSLDIDLRGSSKGGVVIVGLLTQQEQLPPRYGRTTGLPMDEASALRFDQSAA